MIPLICHSTDWFSSTLDISGGQVLEDLNDAIAAAITDLGLLHGDAFQARVMQLSQLSAIHQSVSYHVLFCSCYSFPGSFNSYSLQLMP